MSGVADKIRERWLQFPRRATPDVARRPVCDDKGRVAGPPRAQATSTKMAAPLFPWIFAARNLIHHWYCRHHTHAHKRSTQLPNTPKICLPTHPNTPLFFVTITGLRKKTKKTKVDLFWGQHLDSSRAVMTYIWRMQVPPLPIVHYRIWQSG